MPNGLDATLCPPISLESVTAQWVQLGGGETLVASHQGAWVQAPQPAAFALWGSMPRSLLATLETTRHLLDGAIAAAARAAAPSQSPPLTAGTWALHLVDQWYTAHHSVALLPVAIERFESMRRPELARFARRKLEEEAGHDRLPLNDLGALGYDAEAAVKEVPPGRIADALVKYAQGCVYGPCPVSFFGYVYALERRVIGITEQMLSDLAGVLPSGVDAASGVRAHAVEFDLEHVEELVHFIAGLPADDRTEIALACRDTTAKCCAAVAPADELGDLERERLLWRFRNPTAISTQVRSEQ